MADLLPGQAEKYSSQGSLPAAIPGRGAALSLDLPGSIDQLLCSINTQLGYDQPDLRDRVRLGFTELASELSDRKSVV